MAGLVEHDPVVAAQLAQGEVHLQRVVEIARVGGAALLGEITARSPWWMAPPCQDSV